MESFWEIVKYTLPALIVFLATFLSLKKVLDHNFARYKMEVSLQNQKLITPIRLQAYERMALLLERISPESLLMRISEPHLTAKNLQSALLKTVRAEFDHNLSQQIYISQQAWEVIKNARSNIIKLINTTAGEIKPGTPGLEFSKKLLDKVMEQEKQPTQVALEFLKNEMRQFF